MDNSSTSFAPEKGRRSSRIPLIERVRSYKSRRHDGLLEHHICFHWNKPRTGVIRVRVDTWEQDGSVYDETSLTGDVVGTQRRLLLDDWLWEIFIYAKAAGKLDLEQPWALVDVVTDRNLRFQQWARD